MLGEAKYEFGEITEWVIDFTWIRRFVCYVLGRVLNSMIDTWNNKNFVNSLQNRNTIEKEI